jgi:hypothetical protein
MRKISGAISSVVVSMVIFASSDCPGRIADLHQRVEGFPDE